MAVFHEIINVNLALVMMCVINYKHFVIGSIPHYYRNEHTLVKYT